VMDQGLVGGHHFYINFKTHDLGVEIPDYLKERFPDEMTIVLQKQFWGLKVEDEKFEVTLTFQKLPATLVVPYAALTGFADPSVKFGLQFRNASAPIATEIKGEVDEIEPLAKAKDSHPSEGHQPAEDEHTSETDKTASGESQVVNLDQFRKK
jgi:hypothetical protein